MRFEAAAFLALLFGVVGLLRNERLAILSFVTATLFAATSAITLPALSGASITVPYILLGFYVLRLILHGGESLTLAMRALRPPSPGFWLLLLTSLGLLSVYFGPLLFVGKVEVYTPDRAAIMPDADCLACNLSARVLYFGTSYITQAIYAVGGFIAYTATRIYLRSPEQYGYFVRAMIALCWLNLLLVVLDYISYFTGTGSVIDWIRSANYTHYGGYLEGGLLRVSGAFPEPSAFASFTAPLFVFCLNLWLYNIRRRTTGLLAVMLFIALALSTSTTAYVSVMAYLALDLAVRLWRAPRKISTRRMWVLGGSGALMVLILVFVVIGFLPAFADTGVSFFERNLFGKLHTASGLERMMWNRQALEVFFDTHMLGVGLGGSIASSFPLVMLSNLGLPGALLFLILIVTTLFGKPSAGTDPRVRAVIGASRAALLMKLISMAVSQRIYDPGLSFYLLLGLAATEPAVSAARSRLTLQRQSAARVAQRRAWVTGGPRG